MVCIQIKGSSFRTMARKGFLVVIVATSVCIWWLLVFSELAVGPPVGRGHHADRATVPSKPCNYSGILAKFPWLNRKNAIPNHFTKDGRNSRWRNTSVVFIHHQKSGGGTVKGCLRNMADIAGIPPAVALNSDNFNNSYRLLRSEGPANAKLYQGGYTFGVCDRLRGPCSYFIVVREPYARMVSHFACCNVSRSGPNLCHPSGSRGMTAVEWALFVGSYLFRQLFNDAELCHPRYMTPGFAAHIRQVYALPQGSPISCFQIHKLYLDYHVAREEKDVLLQYFLENLENWFTFIGLTEDFDLSVQMLQEVYDLPFVEGCLTDNKLPSVHKRSHLDTFTTQSLQQSLRDDRDVFKVLHYDIQLYKKAVEIYNKQKKIFFDLNSK